MGGGTVGDPFINQTAGAEPRRAPLNRKPPGVFERNILQLCVSTSAVYLRANVDGRGRGIRASSLRIFLDADENGFNSLCDLPRIDIAHFSEPGPLRFPRSSDCVRTGNMRVRRERERERRQGKWRRGKGGCFSAM